MTPERPILLVEDDSLLAELIVDYLGNHGVTVMVEPRGDRAIERILTEAPLAVILDLGLPGADGFEVCRRVRQDYRGFILILTAQGDEVDEIACLELGADDFLSKPVTPRLLLARLKALLRRQQHVESAPRSQVVRVGELEVYPGRREAVFHGEALDLTTGEFDLLTYLAERAGETVSRQELYEELRGIKYDGLDRSIDLRVSRLRSKLEAGSADPELIKSVRGVGYLLAVPA